jgi:hypothetical protein
VITVTGTNFPATGEIASVKFDTVSAPSYSVESGTLASVTTPPHPAGAVDVTVVLASGGSASLPSAFTFIGPPVIGGVSPASGPTAGGTAIGISGSDFQAGATVTVGNNPATVVTATPTLINAVTPAGAAGATTVTVLNLDGQTDTSANAFIYIAPPVITSVSPASGPTAGGTAIAISGSGFQAGAIVTVGGNPATGVTVTTTLINAVTPAGTAGAAKAVVVVNPDGQSAANAFVYVAPPAPPIITGVSPASGSTAGGTAFTITGSGFQAGATVAVGGNPATAVAVAATLINATTPAGTTGPKAVTVLNPDGQSATAANAFTFNGPPVIASVSPASGSAAGGTAIAITGSGFLAGATVTVGGTAAAVVTVTATLINATTPPGTAGAKNVTVQNSDAQSATAANAFTYITTPVITSVSPASGPIAGGTAIAITGSGFQTGATVTVGGTAAAVVTVTATLINATTPAGTAGAKTVTVQNPGGLSATATNAFTFNGPPVIASVSPASGSTAGGTAIAITGSGFQPGATATVGGNPATAVPVTATLINATTPAGSAGAKAVTVLNPDGQSATAANAFTYITPPVITSVSPASGPIVGGTAIAITGSGFQAGATVTVGGTAAAVVTVTATLINATTPAGTAGAKNVTVQNPGGLSVTETNGFLFIGPPVIASVSPASGSTAGGTAIAITGSDFQAGATVTVGGTAAAVVTVTATLINATTPAGSAGAKAVTVLNPDGQSATAANAFTYVTPTPPGGAEPFYTTATDTLIDSENFDGYAGVTSGTPHFSTKYSVGRVIAPGHTGTYPNDNSEALGIVTLTTGRGGTGKALRLNYAGATGAEDILLGTEGQLGSIGALTATLPERAGPYTHFFFQTWIRFSVGADPGLAPNGSGVKGIMLFFTGDNTRYESNITHLDNTDRWSTTRWNYQGGYPSNAVTGRTHWKTANGEPPLFAPFADNAWHRITREVFGGGGHNGERMWLDGVLVFDNVDDILTGNDPRTGSPWNMYTWAQPVTHFMVLGNFGNTANAAAVPNFTVDLDDWVAWTR